MKRFSTVLSSVAAIAAVAFSAADASAQSRQPMWAGLYGGINAGVVLGSVKVADPTTTFRWDHDGMALGLHAGYNFQFNQLVAGVEGDIAWSNANGTQRFVGGSIKTESEYMGSIRARLGLAYSSLLFYGTVGYGFGDVKATVVGGTGNSGSFDGIAYGAGMEAKFTRNMSARIESLHYGFRKSENDGGVTVKSELPQTVIRAGITFHLN